MFLMLKKNAEKGRFDTLHIRASEIEVFDERSLRTRSGKSVELLPGEVDRLITYLLWDGMEFIDLQEVKVPGEKVYPCHE